jgi:hypothetical protein
MIKSDRAVPFAYASINKNRVVQAGENVLWCQFSPVKESYKLLQEINRGYARQEFDVFIFYKDIYGNAWVTRKSSTETEPCDPHCREALLTQYARQ